MGLDGPRKPSDKARMKIASIIIALAVAAIAFAIGSFMRPAGSDAPPPEVLPIFALLILLESLAFGAGVAYVIRQRRRLLGAGIPPLERAIAWSVAYLLLAPWPHDYLHAVTHVNGVFNWPALAGIEFVFHLGIVPVGILIGAHVLRAREADRALA